MMALKAHQIVKGWSMWLLVIIFLGWSYIDHTLTVGMVFYTVLIVVLINGVRSAAKTKTVTIAPANAATDNINIMKLERKIAALEKTNSDLVGQNRHLEMRASVAMAAARTFNTNQSAPRFDNESLKILRNTLMKHHEQRHLDVSYKGSKIAADTNHIIGQLNGYIAEGKK